MTTETVELPLTIRMQIDLSAQAHKREIAEGFAALRERLLPPPKKDHLREFLNRAMQSQQAAMMPQRMGFPYGAAMAGASSGGLLWHSLIGNAATAYLARP